MVWMVAKVIQRDAAFIVREHETERLAFVGRKRLDLLRGWRPSAVPLNPRLGMLKFEHWQGEYVERLHNLREYGKGVHGCFLLVFAAQTGSDPRATPCARTMAPRSSACPIFLKH
eukprot:m.872970 g.872970  ORF g.872970 m.872970 type:complete len:115 (+) comp59784_c0_seq13:1191-1535(+)